MELRLQPPEGVSELTKRGMVEEELVVIAKEHGWML